MRLRDWERDCIVLRPKGVVAQPSPVQPGYRFYLFSCTVLIDCWIQVCDVTDTQGRAGGRASERSVGRHGNSWCSWCHSVVAWNNKRRGCNYCINSLQWKPKVKTGNGSAVWYPQVSDFEMIEMTPLKMKTSRKEKNEIIWRESNMASRVYVRGWMCIKRGKRGKKEEEEERRGAARIDRRRRRRRRPREGDATREREKRERGRPPHYHSPATATIPYTLWTLCYCYPSCQRSVYQT